MDYDSRYFQFPSLFFVLPRHPPDSFIWEFRRSVTSSRCHEENEAFFFRRLFQAADEYLDISCYASDHPFYVHNRTSEAEVRAYDRVAEKNRKVLGLMKDGACARVAFACACVCACVCVCVCVRVRVCACVGGMKGRVEKKCI